MVAHMVESLGTTDDLATSACSTAIVGADKSNYWSPLLYHRYPNDTYSAIMGQTRIYYFSKGDNVQPFPKGLRMITGTAMTRDADATQSLGIKIACNKGDTEGTQGQYLPTYADNPGGCDVYALGIYFPSESLLALIFQSDL